MTAPRKIFSPLSFIYVVMFFFSLHVALPAYINSTFLETLLPERFIGLIFTAASALSIAALVIVPRILRLIGDYFATALFIALEIGVMIGIAALKSPLLVVAFFLVSQALITLVSFDLDLMVEGFSAREKTGSIRGLYLTFANVAWVAAPALGGFLLGNGTYWRVYVAGALVLIPTLLILTRGLERFKDPLYRVIHFRQAVRAVWRDKNLRNIFFSSILLGFFFTLMVIYTPLYLHEYQHIPWDRLGILFSFMLLPFLFLEAPLGRLADRVLGEKEMLAVGFFIMAATTAALTLVGDAPFLTFALLLFGTRVGAAMAEVMTESYFFKKVDGADAELISLQRSLRPMTGIAAPLFATLLLAYMPLSGLFFALGALMLLGVPLALGVKDTR